MPLNGARLREAREARELSGVALARKVGLAPSTISKYESGDKHPPPAVIDALAEVLDLPVTFLTRESQPDYSDRLTFRSRSAASKALRVRETRLFHWTVEIAGFLRGVALFPQVNFPEYDVPDDPRALSNDQIDEIAESIRKFWKLGDRPVPSVVEVLEDNGAMVVRREVGSELIDAYSEWRYGIPHIILAADKFAAARSRLDAAHELGHLLLHRSAPAELMNQPAIT